MSGVVSMRLVLAVMLAMATVSAAAQRQAGQAPGMPTYDVEPCCDLCPQASDPLAYEGSYLDSFRMLVQGTDGWLFRTQDDLLTTFGMQPASYAGLARFQQALADLGVTLVMVPLPPRGLMQWRQLSEQTARGYARDTARVGYRLMLDDLRQRGVVVPALEEMTYGASDTPFYFRRDHHWTPAGARRTAEVVADAIRGIDGVAAVPRSEFVTRQEGIVRKSGTYSRAVEKLCGFGYPEQVVDAYATSTPGQASDLFGEASEPQIVLVGTSNSAPDYNFAGFLSQELERDVFNAAETGGGVDGAMLAYLRSPAFRRSPPKVLIWEMPVYTNFDDDEMHRQLVPLVHDGCAAQTAVLSNETPVQSAGLTEVLFNGGGEVQPLQSRDHLLDVRVSDPSIRELQFSVWYTNGKNDRFSLTGGQAQGESRFVARLRADEDFADGVFMGLDIGPMRPDAPDDAAPPQSDPQGEAAARPVDPAAQQVSQPPDAADDTAITAQVTLCKHPT